MTSFYMKCKLRLKCVKTPVLKESQILPKSSSTSQTENKFWFLHTFKVRFFWWLTVYGLSLKWYIESKTWFGTRKQHINLKSWPKLLIRKKVWISMKWFSFEFFFLNSLSFCEMYKEDVSWNIITNITGKRLLRDYHKISPQILRELIDFYSFWNH